MVRVGRGWVGRCVLAAWGVAAPLSAQGVLGDGVMPGVTVASAVGAEAARLNPAGVGIGRPSSARLTYAEALHRGATQLPLTTVAWATPLPLGFGLSLGASLARPRADAGAERAMHGTAEVGVGYALDTRLSVGLRWRLHAGLTDGASGVDGRSSLDLGALWRPSSYVAVGAMLRGAAGPEAPAIGVERGAVAGVAVRPTGTDALTVGVDGALGWTGDAWVRAGVRAAVPRFGAVRAEGLWDGGDGWRASLGVEVQFGRGSAALAGVVSGGAELSPGAIASVGWDSQAHRASLPTGDQVVTVSLTRAPTARSFATLLWSLERLRRDPSVRGVVFAPRAEVGGLAHAEELQEAFARVRRAGIQVVCHLTDATASTWYACAAVDRVVVDPAGGVRLAGLRSARYFLGPALWSLGVRTDFVRVGDWKSAPEQLARGASSEASRAQEGQLLDDWLGGMVNTLAAARRMTAAEARSRIESGPYTAASAREGGLADDVATLSTTERWLARRLDAAQVDYEAYVPVRSGRWALGPSVAVVYVDGDIVDGASSEIPLVGARMVGERTVAAALEAAEADPRVRAVVLRIDSPGGSALASDLLWRAVARVARRKPVVASMGRMAASGGYYIASAAREIFADDATLTGSIGIFYGKADLAGLLGRLQVGVELDRRGPRADMESVFRPYTPEERTFLAARVGEYYQLFLRRVAEGRRRGAAEIDAVGEGRVYIGSRARSLGLVDREGGLLAAVDRARALAGLDDASEVVELPRAETGLLGTLTRLLGASAEAPSALEPLLRAPAVRLPLAWALTVSTHAGAPMALLEDPVGVP